MSKIMLKLVSSGFRYVWVNCDSVLPFRNRVQHFSTITCRRIPPYNAKFHICLNPSYQMHYYSRINNDLKVNEKEPMSDSFPHNAHASVGGEFKIYHAEVSEHSNWIMQENSSQEPNSSNRIPKDFRIWEGVDKDNGKGKRGVSFKFKVLSYNVLAQYLLECHPYLYTSCSPEILKWNVRSKLLFNEITKLDPDILCLQEVQIQHLDTFFKRFEYLGYSGIFKQKTGFRQDGCAIYFKKSVFSVQDHMGVEFYQPQLPLLNRDNIGVMVKLIPHCMPKSPIVVATTHLLYNPKRTDVRLAQIQVFLAEIDRFSYINSNSESGHCPIILTGDLNSTPQSAVINLLDDGCVSSAPFRDLSDWKKIGVTDNCQHLSVYLDRQRGEHSTNQHQTKIHNSDYRYTEVEYRDDTDPAEYHQLFNTGLVGHSLQLKSVYDRIKHNGLHEASTFQEYWVTVDYIYFSCHSSLNLSERLRLPTADECEVLGSLPNHVYGSDHLSLGAVFEINFFNS